MVSRFIKGTLAEDDFEAISEEFVDGGVLSLAVTKAQRLISEKNYQDAELLLREALDSVDGNNTYTDSSTTQWRVFMNYVDRVLYNRILSNPEKNTRLAPMSTLRLTFWYLLLRRSKDKLKMLSSTREGLLRLLLLA